MHLQLPIAMHFHADSDRLARAMARCIGLAVPWSGSLYRSASPRYANRDDLTTGAGSKATGARWNPPNSFRAVYTSVEVETALAEVLAHFRYYRLPIAQAMPRVIVSLEATLRRVLDLSDGATRRALGVSGRRLLTEPWRELQKKRREAITQAVGRLVYDAGLEALLVPSAARKGGHNLVIFPANLDAPGSWLRIINRDDLPPRG
jgi:RES domain-containing protein